ncbi:PLP-dependent aminotransferase family protein [Nocardia cyriacigeorgica]|uniref:PLP-dependent aminotransferase family protein n=1 Tax=Nocardia cyriacigeorgica TaxID=135487 RepID=A0A5R8PBL5_9NOCA|nr:PLP-dependent aminotransferase family protein [Nocardia cyriacigeorgica]TLG05811.1 PLP-dependent aminotransferase family protein [Nocardia cyriacigeorgica]
MEPIDVAARLGRWATGRGPLYVLLAGRIRRLIDDGDLPPGGLLPPDRLFAKQLAVGRNTVVAAYDLLAAEGRIVRRQGSGTRVAGSPVPQSPETTSAPMFLDLLEPDEGVVSLSCAAPLAPPPAVTSAFAQIVPELAGISADIGYHPAGLAQLRAAIARRYTAAGAPTSADRILITNGGQQALSLLARALIDPGDQVVVEAPAYPGALEVFREASAVVHALPIGLDGFEAVLRDGRPALAYLTPTFQNPTGTVLPPLVRRRVTELAARAEVPVLADEVPADLGFPGAELPPPLCAVSDAVISIGSLSKNLWGGLRIGWIRASSALVARLTRIRAVHDLGGSMPTQMAAARLIPDLDALCREQAAHRAARHDRLLTALAERLPDWSCPAVAGGQTVWARLPYGDGDSLAQTALRHGVSVLGGRGLDPTGRSNDCVRLHFRHPESVLDTAVERLALAWGDYRVPVHRGAPPPQLVV